MGAGVAILRDTRVVVLVSLLAKCNSVVILNSWHTVVILVLSFKLLHQVVSNTYSAAFFFGQSLFVFGVLLKWQKHFRLFVTVGKTFKCCCVSLLLQRSRSNSTINILVFCYGLIVKVVIFTGLYLGPWYEHSVQTNTVAVHQPGQHIPKKVAVVKIPS